MIIEKSYINKSKSVYKCDRCEKPLKWEDKVAIYIGLPSRSPKKKWDLCKKCYSALVKGIEKK